MGRFQHDSVWRRLTISRSNQNKKEELYRGSSELSSFLNFKRYTLFRTEIRYCFQLLTKIADRHAHTHTGEANMSCFPASRHPRLLPPPPAAACCIIVCGWVKWRWRMMIIIIPQMLLQSHQQVHVCECDGFINVASSNRKPSRLRRGTESVQFACE